MLFRSAHLVNGAFATNSSTVGLPYYAFDTHACQLVVKSDNTLVAEGVVSNGLFPSNALLPSGIIMPPVANISNLLSAVCIAATHVAWSTLRTEPNLGGIGESAGIYAALAAKQGIAVQSVNYTDVRQTADWFGLWSDNGVTLTTDGTTSGTGTGNGVSGGNLGTVVSAGTWTTVTTVKTYDQSTYLACTATTGTNTLTLTPALTQSGAYDIYLCWHDAGGTAGNSPTTRGTPTIAITANGVTSSFTVNQSAAGEGGGNGFYAGRFNCNKTGTNNLVITADNSGNSNSLVWAKWVPVSGVQQ